MSPAPSPPTKVDTSIVLATCSRSAMLRDALASLLDQSWDPACAIEIVVVDDVSTDETPAVLAEFQRRSPIPFTILQGAGLGVAAARNLGSNRAAGTWLASFDDDQIALPGWLRELRSLADSTHAACIGGALALQLPADSSLENFGPRVRRVLGEHLLGDDPIRYSTDPHPSTNNVLIRRDVFVALGGYDVSFTEGGEDKEFFTRVASAGHQMWYQPRSAAMHVMTPRRLDPSNVRWTCLRVGATDNRVQQRRLPFFGPLGLCAKRLAVTLLRDLPQFLVARLQRDARAELDVKCSLWYTEGQIRSLLPILGARTERSAFMRSIDFRSRNGERPGRTLRSDAT